MFRKRRGGLSALDPQLAVAYLRASTPEQLLGREEERVEVQRWAGMNAVTIVAEFVDQGVSGSNDVANRPELGKALAALLEHGAGILLVKDRTRLARDVIVAATIDRSVADRGARVVSADGVGNGDTPADGFVRAIVDAASELHRMTIKANTRSALAAKRRRGERIGALPFGQRLSSDGVHMEPDARELAAIDAARRLRGEGRTVRAIVEELELLGFVSRGGQPLSVAAVNKIVSVA
jgi:DNA invertase Pin-like site-specific DNA recombinase